TVILPYWEARHPDHYNASTLSYEGCFLAGLKQLSLEGEAFRPFKILYCTSFEGMPPTFIVDITKQYQTRRRAILAYRSQFRPAKSERKQRVFLAIDELDSRMDLLARHYGALIGVKYGEPFLQKETLQIEDVVNLPARSIYSCFFSGRSSDRCSFGVLKSRVPQVSVFTPKSFHSVFHTRFNRSSLF